MSNNVPRAVQEQIEKVNQFYNKEGDQTDLPGETEVSEEAPVLEQEVKPDEPKVVIPDNEEATYEKRFKNYKAQADEKIHTYRQQLAQLEETKRQNEILQQQLRSVEETKPKFSEEALKSFSNEELEVFDKMVNERTSGLVGELTTLKQQLASKQQEDLNQAKQKQHLTLKQKIANAVGDDFEKIDRSPEFSKWLNQLDAYGSLRMDNLRDAQVTKDIGRIVSFYNDFKQIQEPVKVDPRELQQVPNGSSGPIDTSQVPYKEVWDTVKINEFYKNAALKKYTQEQRVEIEADIHNYLMNR